MPDQVLGRLLPAFEEARLRLAFAQNGGALGAVDHVAEEAPAVRHMPALGQQPRAVGKGVFHRVMVEQLIGLGADLAAALPWAETGQASLTQQQTSMLWISQSSRKLPLSQVKLV